MAGNASLAECKGSSIDWETTLAAHQRWMRTVVLARSGDPQAVDEIMQEIAVAAVGQSSPLKDPQKVAPWLYRLAVRQALLHRRRLGRQRRLHQRFENYVVHSADHQSNDPLSWLLADEFRQVMRTAMERLGRKHAEILMLKYCEGWSYRQLAEHLGLSTNAVESRLYRARQRLRGQLATLNVLEAHS